MDNKKLQEAFKAMGKVFFHFNEKKEQKFEGIKVKDSDSMVEYAALEVGADVSISTGSGSEVAPDGKYALVNDVEFTVKEGKIKSIENTGDATPAEEVPKEEELADVAEDAPQTEELPKEDEAVKALEERVKTLEDTLKTLQESINAVPSNEEVTELKKQVKQFNSHVKNLSTIPTQFSADSRVEVRDSEMDKYIKMAERYSK